MIFVIGVIVVKTYIITKIFDHDFGCEGIQDGSELLVDLSIRDVDGNALEVSVSDSELVKKNINEGDWVYFTNTGEIRKEA